MRLELENIGNNYDGFQKLINLWHQCREASFENIKVDMGKVTWFEANMSAPLGAVLHKISSDLNSIAISNVPPKVEGILRRNRFLLYYGRSAKMDGYGTTIPYQTFEPKDDRYFGQYLQHYLTGKNIPAMTAGLRKKFLESVFEIFSNAVLHSQTRLGISSCGQFFPKKHRLDFSIVDLGIGIRQNIAQKAGLNLSAEQAIDWAMTGRNTTKTDSVPGGLGLKLLREFIGMNQGRIQIVSDRGYWELQEGRPELNTFSAPFPGTVVTLEFNTADTKSYCLTEEISPDDIF